MTYRFSRPKGITRFGLFHNLDCDEEEVKYITLHLFGARFEVYWLA